jgi:hypothetical protein
VQLFGGVFRARCYSRDHGHLHPELADQMCTLTSAVTVNSAGGMYRCPLGYECLPNYRNPQFQVVHFDNIGGAMMVRARTASINGSAGVR